MIIDATGIELTPGKFGEYCLGNGKHIGEDGNVIECCCDECNYLLCCIDENFSQICKQCRDSDCARSLGEGNLSPLLFGVKHTPYRKKS